MSDAKLIKAASHDQRVVIIGTGFIGMETASALAQAGTTASITVVGQGSRVMGNIVSETVSNSLIKLHEEKGINFVFDATVNEITKVDRQVDKDGNNNIELRLNQTVSEVLPNEATVVIEDDDGNSERQTADFLVVATGAKPNLPPIKGAEMDGVYTLRSMSDAKLIKAASHDQRVVIIGTGFIGMETASALAQAGTTASITVVGQGSRVMGNIVSETVSNSLIKLHEEKGINFVFDATVNEITKVDRQVDKDGNNNNQAFSNVGGVTLANGEHIDADIVILGTGVSPRTEILSEVNDPDGVQVDAHLQLRDGVYALGDIAKASNQMGRMRIEHWRVALQHGMVTAAAILNDDSVDSLEARIPFFWTMQYGKSLRYSGHAETPDYNILFGTPDTHDYIEYYFDDEGEDTRASAASTLGRDKELVAFSELLRRGHAPTRAQLNAGLDIIEQAHALSP